MLLVTAAAIQGAPLAASAADAYVIGISAGMTGPVAANYAPVAEAIRVYFDRVNAAGGINGHPVEIVISDNQAQPQKAAADIKSFVSNDAMLMAVNASLSNTYAPMVAETAKAGMPLVYAGGVCPEAVFPPADKLQFCTTAFATKYDARFGVDYIAGAATGPVKLATVAMSIPISRETMDNAAELAKARGMEVVDQENVPPPTPNYLPFATKIKAAGANWGFSWAPWVTQVKTFESLKQLGWEGRYLSYAHINAEDELKRVKNQDFIVFGSNALFADGLPIHADISAAIAQGGASYPVTYMAEGWVAAMALEDALRKVGWPADRGKMAAALARVDVDLEGLRGGNLKWTDSNHFREVMHYRVYRWDDAKGAIVREGDWVKVDVN
jgi:ABC-type branched-subunit amino acid transport system substrate-binding protein